MTDWNEFFKQYRQKVHDKVELASSLGSQVVGNLFFFYNGKKRTPERLYFAMGANGDEEGACYTHFDNALRPVYQEETGDQLVKPEWSELCASFKDGAAHDFYYE